MASKLQILPAGYHLSPHVSIAEIQEAVCAVYSLPLSAMSCESRVWTVSHPRQLAMYLCRELTPHSYPSIGRRFGDRDHTTVIHAVKAVKKRQKKDDALAGAVAFLCELLKPVDRLVMLEAA